MKNQALIALYEYWKHIFEGIEPNYKISKPLFDFPYELEGAFDVEYFPEPFYGYIHEDMRNDILVPLINPGEIKQTELKYLYPNTEDPVIASNGLIKNRHLTWSKVEYLNREKKFSEMKSHWRTTKFGQCQFILKDIKFDFMHTIEFFPYHSKNWNVKNNIQKEWIYQLKSTKLMIHALEELARNGLVKHILGISKVWPNILNHYPNLFVLEDYEIIYGPNGGRAYEMYKYRTRTHFTNSIPLVFCSGSSMNLPKQEGKPTEVLRRFLEL